MSTISPVQDSQIGIASSKQSAASSTSETSFSKTWAETQELGSMLTTAETSSANRPNIKQFMNRTGINFLDSSDLIYGVIGSNTDVRDWAKIMASNDPVTAVRQATAEMYGRTHIVKRTDATYMEEADTVAKEGNFAIRLLKDDDAKVLDEGLKITDAQGLILRDAGKTPKQIARNAWLFGLSTTPLGKLVNAASSVSEPLAAALNQASVDHAYQPKTTLARTDAITQEPSKPASVLTSMPAEQQASIESTPYTSKPKTEISGTSPELRESIQEAAQKSLSEIDTMTYLRSLFYKLS